ncbi:FTR1 family protein [Candidatus Gottesmanbacteria bacterium]|nr:FTR1 family protein [Candidatus Gottesmanbacteria bacterium]
MIPSFLITFREVIEASLIVATILGILVKLNQKKSIKTVWIAAGAATFISITLLGLGSLFGLKVQELYSGKTEEFIEGILMVTSAVFITWAVFFLHKYFAQYKTRLLQKIKATVEKEEQKGLFLLVFTAVFREGFEIVLFLSTVYFSSNPQSIFTGFALGTIGGLLISLGLFTATLRLPVFYAFRVTSILLILFAAGLLARGIHEFAEVGIIPEIGKMTFAFIPAKATFTGDMLKAIFGITQKMDLIQLSLYSAYVALMSWWVFFRNANPNVPRKEEK